MLFVAVVFMFSSLNVNAEELATDLVSEEPVISENNEQVSNDSTEEQVVRETPQKEVQDETDDIVVSEVHKVSVIINKTDETGKPLSGATIQIIDANGNVVDEWVSDGTAHEVLLPEGNYTLHEVSAPEGYIKGKDQSFVVEVKIVDVNAYVDHTDEDEICTHYGGGVAQFYIESNGVREEAYCINQNWEEPDNTNYDGVILTPENFRNFVPDADKTMTDEELYNKVLDIIYHRINIDKEVFDLTDVEIKLITEFALKNYTSTDFNNGVWARQYAYDENNNNGYVLDPGNGTTLGRLATHWKSVHKQKIPKIYADYYYWLIRDEDHHPSDMYLYIYSTKSISDDGPYQNLLSIKWFNPYDDDNQVELTLVNYKKDTGKTEIVPPVTGISSNNTSNSYLLIILLSVLGFSLSLKRRFN